MLSKNVSNLSMPMKCKSLTYSYFHKSHCMWLCCIPDAWTTLQPLKKATAFPPDMQKSVSDIRHRNGNKDFCQFSHKTPHALLLQHSRGNLISTKDATKLSQRQKSKHTDTQCILSCSSINHSILYNQHRPWHLISYIPFNWNHIDCRF